MPKDVDRIIKRVDEVFKKQTNFEAETEYKILTLRGEIKKLTEKLEKNECNVYDRLNKILKRQKTILFLCCFIVFIVIATYG